MKKLTIEELQSQFNHLNLRIQNIISAAGYDADNVPSKSNDLDYTFKRDQYLSLLRQLEDISSEVNYLNKPISIEGRLYKNTDGRYAFPNGDYLTSGNTVELLCQDEYDTYWVKTTIEHSEDYYALDLGKEVSLEGMTARMR